MVDSFRSFGDRLRNWGRFGDEDERGTVNFITPERLVRAAGLIRRGTIFDLGIPFDSKGPQTGDDRINPMRFMSETGAGQLFPGGFQYADDYVFMALQSASQWDALAHVFYDDQLYNGFSSDLVGVHGAKRGSIDKLAKGIAGRGVLLDIARLKGVEWLAMGEVILPSDLDEAVREQHVEIATGDIVLVRTGWRKKFLVENDAAAFMAGEPGLGLECADWLHAHEVAAVCSDNWAVEVLPEENPEELLGLHMVLIRDMGMTLGELLDFEELAADCSLDGVWDFFFCGPPLKFTGAVGSPINPLAIK